MLILNYIIRPVLGVRKKLTKYNTKNIMNYY